MKKLTSEELQTLQLRQKGRFSPVYYAIVNLETGETLHLLPSDWNQKGSPTRMIGDIMKKLKRQYSCASIINQPGWVITRIS